MKSGVSGVGSSHRPGSGRVDPPWMAARCCDSRLEEDVQAWAASGLVAGNIRGSSGSGATPRRLQSQGEHAGGWRWVSAVLKPYTGPPSVTLIASCSPDGLVQPAKSVAACALAVNIGAGAAPGCPPHSGALHRAVGLGKWKPKFAKQPRPGDEGFVSQLPPRIAPHLRELRLCVMHGYQLRLQSIVEPQPS
jgi:hypothetical protein